MDFFRAALLALAAVGVNGVPFDDLKVRRNDAANTTSSEPEIRFTVFAPRTAVSELTLALPEALTTYTPVFSPVTALSQISLETPSSEETGATTEEYTSQSKQPKAIVQPTQISLILPVTGGGSDSTSFTNVVPTVVIEKSGTILTSAMDTTSMRPTMAPKMPHLEQPGSELDQPSIPTNQPDVQEGDGSRDSESAGPDATITHPTKAGVVVVGETSIAESEEDASTPTQDAFASPEDETSAGSQTPDAHASIEEEISAVSQTHGAATSAEQETGAGFQTQGAAAESESDSGSQTQNAQANSAGSITAGGNAETPASPTLAVDNTPLTPGGSPITVDGTTYSLASTGSAVFVNGNAVSFTTNAQSHIVPVETTADASVGDSIDFLTSEALGSLSFIPAETTTDSETARETGSLGEQQSTGSTSGTRTVVVSTATTTGGSAGATTTSDGSESDTQSDTQSDDSGAPNLQKWSIAGILGAIGLLAVVV